MLHLLVPGTLILLVRTIGLVGDISTGESNMHNGPFTLMRSIQRGGNARTTVFDVLRPCLFYARGCSYNADGVLLAGLFASHDEKEGPEKKDR